MDTTIRAAGTNWRAITDGAVALLAYIVIVVWEYLIAFVMLVAGMAWARALTGRPRGGRLSLLRLDTAARLSSLGWTMAIILFFGGFLTIGGEWFRMWASKSWNAESAALQNVLIAGVGLILVHLPEPAVGPRPAARGASSRR